MINWDALSAVAETLGTLGIFVSLAYVALQIRQNTQQFVRSSEETKLHAFERSVASGNRVRELLLLNPALTQLFMRGSRSLHALDTTDRFRFSLLLRNVFSEFQGAYVRQSTVEHDPERFSGTISVLDELIAGPGVREWLRGCTTDWHPDFTKLVQQRLQKASKTQAREAA